MSPEFALFRPRFRSFWFWKMSSLLGRGSVTQRARLLTLCPRTARGGGTRPAACHARRAGPGSSEPQLAGQNWGALGAGRATDPTSCGMGLRKLQLPSQDLAQDTGHAAWRADLTGVATCTAVLLSVTALNRTQPLTALSQLTASFFLKRH